MENRALIIQHYVKQKQREEDEEYGARVDQLYDFGLSLGILRDVLKARSKGWRWVWSVLALFALGMCIFQLTLVLVNFIKNPMNTKISYKVNTSMWFPQVTVCTYARINHTSHQQNQIYSYMLSAYKGMYLYYNQFNIRKDLQNLEKEYQTFLSSQGHNFSLSDFFVKYGFHCRAFLKACMFQGVSFDCCENSVEILSEVGKCFVVKLKGFSVQTIPGPFGGLKLYLFNWASAYPHTMINSNPDSGIQIHLVHPNETTYVGSKPLTIFPGTHAMVRLNAELRVLLPRAEESESCATDLSLRYFDKFTYEGCFTECIAEMTQKTCGCVQIGAVPDYKRLQRGQLCSPQVATACVQPLLQANNMGFLWDMYDLETNCHCPLPCYQWIYATIVSYSKVPNEGYLAVREEETNRKVRNLNTSFGGEEMVMTRMDEIIVDIYYDKLVYTVTEEVALVSSTLFLSQVGGQLSMWLGIRLVTLGHLFFYGLLVVRHIFPVWHYRFTHRRSEDYDNSLSATSSQTKLI